MLEKEVAGSVLEDWRSAPLRPELHATLGFLEKLTLHPETVGPEDAAAVLDAGVSAEALEDAIRVCFLFNIMNRIANALDFRPLDASVTGRVARILKLVGYRL